MTETNDTNTNKLPEQLGIENIKSLLSFGFSLWKKAADALEDGWQWLDAVKFLPEMVKLPSVVKSLPNVRQELADLEEVERDELYSFIVAEFDIPNDQVESFIEDALQWGLAGVSLYEKFRALKNK